MTPADILHQAAFNISLDGATNVCRQLDPSYRVIGVEAGTPRCVLESAHAAFFRWPTMFATPKHAIEQRLLAYAELVATGRLTLDDVPVVLRTAIHDVLHP